MNNVVPLRRVSFVPSEASVVSPYRPKHSEFRRDWRNSDTLHPTPQINIERIKQQVPAANMPTRQLRPAPPQKKPVSLKKRLVALAGVISVSVGTVAGLLSIVALGPIGLAIAAGAAIIGAMLIKAGTQ